MSTALYRRYRPETFAEVIGQQHVTTPLRQALRGDRVHHAYLFSGPRGCGKTTSARILARCLNCVQGPTDTPCGVCDSCVELARGGPGSLDVVEIDAASHGGVDDARELRERATFAPARDRFKIFIIDEAHMVTPQGFNALLKIVEEPPEHITFVFATTEPEKVIGTIRSRTHHYPFHLVPPKTLQDHLEDICRRERIRVDAAVLPLVVRAGAGSVRDSLSVLDQIIAGADESGVDYERAIALLGYTHASLLDDVVGAVAVGDGATVFRVVDRVIESGHDPRRFVEDLLERLRDLIVLQAVGDGARSLFSTLPEDQLARMQQQAASFLPVTLSRAADLANTALTEMTGATSPRLHLELLCARLLLPGAEHSERGLAARLDRLERRLSVSMPMDADPAGPSSGPVPVHPPQTVREEPAPAAAPAEHTGEPEVDQSPPRRSAPAPPATSAAAASSEAVRRLWPDVLAHLATVKRRTWTRVSQDAQVLAVDDDEIVLQFSSAGHLAAFTSGPHADFVRESVMSVLGLDRRVVAVGRGAGAEPSRAAATEPTRSQHQQAASAKPLGPRPAAPPTRPAAPPTRPAAPPTPPEDDVPSEDDPDAEDSGMVGERVVEQMLGGRVIDVSDRP